MKTCIDECPVGMEKINESVKVTTLTSSAKILGTVGWETHKLSVKEIKCLWSLRGVTRLERVAT